MLCLWCGTFFCLDGWPHGPEGENARKEYCSANCKTRAKEKRNPKPSKSDRCPTPEKDVYETIVEARQGAGRVLEKYGELQRPYQCRQHWHLTSGRVWRMRELLLGSFLFGLRDNGTVGELNRLAATADGVDRAGNGFKSVGHDLRIDGIDSPSKSVDKSADDR